jgi:hypothetical protein
MKKNNITGWLILIMAGIFVYLSIGPLLNDTEQFIKIVGGIGVGVAVLILIIMAILSRMLPNESERSFIESNTKKPDKYNTISKEAPMIGSTGEFGKSGHSTK